MAKIAIIGSGISGMGAAYLLHRAGHTITVYEKAPVVGGHSRTLTVDYQGQSIPVDTGFIVYNEPNYPNLVGLFKHLNVATHKSNMSFAITVDGGRFEWGARSLNAVFGQRRNLLRPRFYRMIRDVMRFNARALQTVNAHPTYNLGQLIKHLGLSDGFLRYYLLPMGGAIWSCPPESMLDFPAATFVQFFKNHGLLSFTGQHQWYTVTGGSKEYVKKITAPYLDQIRTNCAAVRVTRSNGLVSVEDSTGNTHTYDQIVFACHANDTLGMLADASTDETSVLGAFTYQKNIAYLHRDETIMPKRRLCWASWVYHATQPGHADERAHGIGVTYWMNLLQGISNKYPLFVTLNPHQPVADDLVFNRHEFEHPVFTAQTLSAQLRLPQLQGKNNSWFCGAYTRYGFHEDGLMSAVKVAESLGAPIPWA